SAPASRSTTSSGDGRSVLPVMPYSAAAASCARTFTGVVVTMSKNAEAAIVRYGVFIGCVPLRIDWKKNPRCAPRGAGVLLRRLVGRCGRGGGLGAGALSGSRRPARVVRSAVARELHCVPNDEDAPAKREAGESCEGKRLQDSTSGARGGGHRRPAHQ